MSGLQLMIPPFVACMVLVAMLSYLGLHVIAREVIFVDLSLAQMAALGGLSALLIHVEADSTWAYIFALFATAVGALLFALTRTSPKEGRRVPQEAFIGVVITLAVPVAGVLMVFSFLVVPAVIAFMFTRDMKRLAYISWGSGALASVLGLWLSLAGDLPTGPLIVCMYGIVLVGAVALRKLMRAPA